MFFFFFISCSFSSSPACYASYFSSTGLTSIALLFLQSCLNAHCVLAYIPCWPLERRILHELYFACAATFRVPPVFDRECFHHLANGSQLHAFSQGCAFLCFIVHAHSIGDRRTETSSYGRKKRKKEKKKKKHRWHCICFQEASSFPCFAMIGNGRVHRLLGTRRKVKIFRRKRSLHRTVLSLTREFALSSQRRATNQCLLSSLDSGKLWYRIVKDSSCVHWKSEEHNSDRWLAFQNRKRDDISNEKYTHRSRFSPAMPRTS